MPTVNVKKNLLFDKIGQKFTDEEFDRLCFEFGIELDDVVTENEDIIYKIDIPANRYDLLCLEGLATALSVFLQRTLQPVYKKVEGEIVTTVSASLIRPFIVTGVLRGVTLTKNAYDSIIELQEKLHFNICRKRQLVAIGIHDLDKVKPPFRYLTQNKNEIEFVPLNQSKSFKAVDLMEFYKSDTHLKSYLHIIKDFDEFPIIYDSEGVVLSMPPIINGDHTKLSLQTKNLFFELTATDLTRANVALDILVTTISEYCKEPFSVETTKVIYENGNESIYPSLEYRTHVLDVAHVNQVIGIQLDSGAMAKSLSKMGLKSSSLSEEQISVEVPPTRHDVIHEIDIIEDVAIAYGFDNIKDSLPNCVTVASQFPVNKLSDQLRESVAMAGFTEALNFALCSVEDECEKICQPPEKELSLVRISNPKTLEFQAARISLLPGILKTIQANRKMPLPLKLFEIGDVILLDDNTDTGARNERHLCAVNYNKSPGFEIIHGLLDRLMQLLEVKFQEGYTLRSANDPTYFPGRCAEILCGETAIGKLGVLHPKVLENFDLTMPCSAIEISIEPFV